MAIAAPTATRIAFGEGPESVTLTGPGIDSPVELIHTPEQEGLVDWGSCLVGWFRASDVLPDTLASVGAPLPDAGVAGSVAIGAPERLGLSAAVGAAVLHLMWAQSAR